MTVVKIPAADCLRHLHAIAASHGLTVVMDRLSPRYVDVLGWSPFHWRLSVMRGDVAVYSVAMERVGEMPAAVVEAWQTFVKGGA